MRCSLLQITVGHSLAFLYQHDAETLWTRCRDCLFALKNRFCACLILCQIRSFASSECVARTCDPGTFGAWEASASVFAGPPRALLIDFRNPRFRRLFHGRFDYVGRSTFAAWDAVGRALEACHAEWGIAPSKPFWVNLLSRSGQFPVISAESWR